MLQDFEEPLCEANIMRKLGEYQHKRYNATSIEDRNYWKTKWEELYNDAKDAGWLL